MILATKFYLLCVVYDDFVLEILEWAFTLVTSSDNISIISIFYLLFS